MNEQYSHHVKGGLNMKLYTYFTAFTASACFIFFNGISQLHAQSGKDYQLKTAFLHTILNDHNLHHTNKHEMQGHHSHKHHSSGCFITTSPQNHARGIRHWKDPCPHRELKHMNPYHPPHHKMRYNPETKSHHRIDE